MTLAVAARVDGEAAEVAGEESGVGEAELNESTESGAVPVWPPETKLRPSLPSALMKRPFTGDGAGVLAFIEVEAVTGGTEGDATPRTAARVLEGLVIGLALATDVVLLEDDVDVAWAEAVAVAVLVGSEFGVLAKVVAVAGIAAEGTVVAGGGSVKVKLEGSTGAGEGEVSVASGVECRAWPCCCWAGAVGGWVKIEGVVTGTETSCKLKTT